MNGNEQQTQFKTYVGTYAGSTFEGQGQTKTGKEWQRHKAMFRSQRPDGTQAEVKFTVFPPLSKSNLAFESLIPSQNYAVVFVATEAVNRQGQSFTAKNAIGFRAPYPEEAIGFHEPLTQQGAEQQQPIQAVQQAQLDDRTGQMQQQLPTQPVVGQQTPLPQLQPQPVVTQTVPAPVTTQVAPVTPQIITSIVQNSPSDTQLKEFAEQYRKQVEAGDYSPGHFIGLYLMNKDRNSIEYLINAFDKYVLGK